MTAAETHALVEIDPGALLLDLRSGQLFRLNQSAALVWRHHLAGESIEEIGRVVAKRYEIPEARARGDAAAALQISDLASVEPAPPEFQYQRSSDGYVFSRLGKPIFQIDRLGQQLSRSLSADLGYEEMRALLVSVAPKLLSLRGETVLHASAVVVGDGVVVFSGASGAGKTTTARAMVTAGASPVCEDKLVVRLGKAGIDAVLKTESVIAAWVDTTVAELVAGRPASCEILADISRSPTIPVIEMAFLSADRRADHSLSAYALAPADAAAAVFSNSFYGSADPDDWRRQLLVSAAVARYVSAFDLTVPDGISGLVEAARAAVARGSLKMRA
ncbi:MAG: hypothetical protein QOI66_962 [Myxococcales bacterium]|jgi:hypothetical protein|nr:hypothetical protein [Myxococcales bacterium]